MLTVSDRVSRGEAEDASGDARPCVALGRAARALAQPLEPRRVEGEVAQRLGQRQRVTRRHEQPVASVLDDDGNLRVLPIIGRGSVQSVADILFLKGVDLGIVRADTLDYLEKKGFANDIKKQFTYVTKLYNEEMQVITPKTIHRMTAVDDSDIFEVSTPELDDVVRLEDRYGREDQR